MNILVFVETPEGKIRKTSLEAVAYAHAMGGTVTAIVLGKADANELPSIGKYGATKVLHAAYSFGCAGRRSNATASLPMTSTSCSISACEFAAVTWIRKPTSVLGTSGYAARVT